MIKRVVITLAATASILALLCMPSIVFYGEQKSIVNLLYALIIPPLVFLIPIIIFRRCIKWYAAAIGIFILLAPIATFPVIYFGDMIGKDMLVIMFNTTYQETWELIKGYLPAIIIIYIIYITLAWLAFAKLPKIISFKTATIISTMALLLTISAVIGKNGKSRLWRHFKATIYTYYPFHLIYAGYTFYKQQSLVRKSEEYIREFPYKDVVSPKVSMRQVYVLLIGESSRYDHWEINGYTRQTSPLSMTQQRLLNFKNVAAAGCLTELSVPQILTGVEPDKYSTHLHNGGIFQLFSQAGYKTYWLSNQTDKGNIRMHASLADSLIWMQNTVATNKHIHYDMELVNIMRKILNGNSNNCLFVIHTNGSHYDYTARYPKLYETFRPVFSINLYRPTEKSTKTKLINAYDNTILYTDAVLNSAINTLRNLNCIAALLYTSDHGENLFDDSKNLVLHAPVPPSYFIAHVPFFIYCSKNYLRRFPLKWKYLTEHTDRRVSNNQSFETLADMANIHYNGENIHNSLADSLFENSRQEILGPNSKIYYYQTLELDHPGGQN